MSNAIYRSRTISRKVSEIFFHFALKEAQPTVMNLAALTALRNQLTIKFGEEQVQPQDDRLALACSWLETAPSAHTVFSIWESTSEV